jgi:hypothetical protein
MVYGTILPSFCADETTFAAILKRLRVFKKKRVLRYIFALRGEEVTGENYIMRSFIICNLPKILLG